MTTRGTHRTAVFVAVTLILSFCITLISSNERAHASGATVNVADYGAVAGDGAEDGPAIRAAISAAIADGPGTNVDFGSGTYDVTAPPRSWSFNTDGNVESWSFAGATGAVSGGYLNVSITGLGATLTSPDNLTLPGAKLPRLIISMKNSTTSTSATLSWLTQDQTSWTGASSVSFATVASDPGYTTYSVDLSQNSSWMSNHIRQLRITPAGGVSSGSVSIDYIQLANVAPESWSFGGTSFDGWSLISDLTGSVSGGSMNLTPTGTDPYMWSPDNLDLTGSSYGTLTVTMKNSTAATIGAVYWTTTADTTWDGVKKITFPINANDPNFTTYSIPLGRVAAYAGQTIKQLRLDPEAGVGSGSIQIQNIGFSLTNPQTYYDSFDYGDVNLNFVGNNTEIDFTNPVTGGFSFTDGSAVTFSGFTFDYTTMPYVEGTISSVNSASDTFDFQPASDYIALMDNPSFQTMPALWGTVRDPSNVYLNKSTANDNIPVLSWTKVNSTTYSLTVPAAYGPLLGLTGQVDVGDNFVLVQRGHNNNIFTFVDDSDISIDGVTVYSSAQSPVVAVNEQGHLDINNLTVERRPGTDRWISTNGDGVHVQEARYGPSITNSMFQGLQDDGVNIYQLPDLVTAVSSSTVMDLLPLNGGTPAVGDQIAIYNPVSGALLGESTITAISGEQVTLASGISGVTTGYDFSTSDAVYDLSQNATGFNVSNNTFEQSRGNGVISKGSDGVIEDNTMSDLGFYYGGIEVQDVPQTPEGPYGSNMVIAGNSLTHVGYIDAGGTTVPQAAAIIVSSLAGNGTATASQNSRNISIVGNTIVDPPRSGIYVGSATNVDITGGNTITSSSSDPTFSGAMAGVTVTNSTNLLIDDLTITDPRSALGAGIAMDASSTAAIGSVTANLASGVPAVSGGTQLSAASFQASADFAEVQGVGGWSYEQLSGGTYSPLTYVPTSASWSASGTTVTAATMTPTSGSAAVRTWVAPGAGTINVTGAVAKVSGSGNPVTASIDQNGTSLWSGSVSGTSPVSPSGVSAITVAAGDQIQFQVADTGTPATDLTSWDPNVSFAPSATYVASAGFTGVQGENQWYYRQWNGSAYSNCTYDAANVRWQGSATYTLITNNLQHPDTGYDSVREWVAPRSGTISITAPVSELESGGNGVVASIWAGGTQLWSATVTYSSPATPTGVSSLSVSAGTAIYFRVNNNGDSNFDTTLWDPHITLS